jgi:hypothetical protein
MSSKCLSFFLDCSYAAVQQSSNFSEVRASATNLTYRLGDERNVCQPTNPSCPAVTTGHGVPVWPCSQTCELVNVGSTKRGSAKFYATSRKRLAFESFPDLVRASAVHAFRVVFQRGLFRVDTVDRGLLTEPGDEA